MTLHFVALGLGLAIVNGCCRLPRGLVGRPIVDLASVDYRVVHAKALRPDVRALVETLRAHAEDWRVARDVAVARQ
ncbi:MAG: hypothetical protein HYV09_31090 [Deltaproteobacteria bacterium]|nr:hypothetical protein [Deltaproteobacteria bacterium]